MPQGPVLGGLQVVLEVPFLSPKPSGEVTWTASQNCWLAIQDPVMAWPF